MRALAVLFAGLILVMLIVANLPNGRPWLIDSFGIQPGQDKLGHFWIMGSFSAALVVATRGLRAVRSRPLGGVWVLLFAVVLVSVDEAIQILIPGRAATWSDLGASLAGIAVLGVGALALCWIVESAARRSNAASTSVD